VFKKILSWLAIAGLIFWVAYDSDSFATVLNAIWHGVVDIASGFGRLEWWGWLVLSGAAVITLALIFAYQMIPGRSNDPYDPMR
jgi:hypothetical protein